MDDHSSSKRTTQLIKFRLIQCPECSHQMCWVNPRLPSYCPMCGVLIYPHVKQHVMVTDDNAELVLHYDRVWG